MATKHNSVIGAITRLDKVAVSKLHKIHVQKERPIFNLEKELFV